MKIFKLLLAFIVASNCMAQEQILPTTIGTAQTFIKSKEHSANTAKTNELIVLPFVDDFSIDRFRDNELGRQVLWETRHATRNTGWGKNPPTVGVVSFDGADSLGYPYDWSPNNSGPADTLLSCPINLDFEGDDGVGMSFYYQPKGNAFFPPGPTDSLILEFFAPELDQWFWIWSTSDASNTDDFAFEYIPINLSKYLKEGFQFRFRNMASLQGALDTWNVDYIWIDQNFTNQNPINNDVAFQKQEHTFLEEFTKMPRDHFATDPAQFMRQTISVQLRNLNDGPRTLEGNQFRVLGISETIKSNPNTPSIGAQSSLDYLHAVASPPDPFIFDPSENDTQLDFEVQLIHGVSDYIPTSSNDTMRFVQSFFTEYAYDDGSAEAAYAVPNTGSQVAMRYTSYKTDSIFAVKIYTMPLGFDHKGTVFTIRVWEDTGEGPGALIAESEHQVEFGDAEYQESVVYSLDEPVQIQAGSFFVGYGQSNQFEGVRVGLDFNTNGNPDNLYFQESNSWSGSQFEGTVMIRPMFTSNGWEDIVASTNDFDFSERVELYPNPASSELNFRYDDVEVSSCRILDLQGRIISEHALNRMNKLDVAHLRNGLYLLLLEDNKGNIGTKKFIISR